jgi:hypothetical protein
MIIDMDIKRLHRLQGNDIQQIHSKINKIVA